MLVYYFTNYKPNEPDKSYKLKKADLDAVLSKCNVMGYEFHPVSEKAEFILHIAICNKFNEEFVIVAKSKDILPESHDPYNFISIKDFLERG